LQRGKALDGEAEADDGGEHKKDNGLQIITAFYG
jgi:hypothetical protein